MSEHTHVYAREHGVVDLAGLPDPRRARDELMQATAGLREEVLRVDRRGRLHTRGLVGLVQTPRLSLEILPKVEAEAGYEADAAFLLRLLSAAGLVPQRLVSAGQVGSSRLPLLEVFMRHAAEHMQETLGSHGVPRRYADVHEDSDTVLGVIDLERAMQQMPHEQNRIPVVHAPFNADNPLSRMLAALADALRRTTSSRRTRQLLDDVVEQLAGAALLPLDEHVVSEGRPAPDEEQWTFEFELARGLCTGILPNPLAPGGSDARVMVFSLHDVFERIIRRSLRTCLADTGWHLAQRPPVRHFLTDTATARPRLQLRPDILVAEVGGRKLHVADAKWKTLKLGHEGVALDRSDVYQLSAYMNRYGLDSGALLVPATVETRQAGSVPWHRRLQIQGSQAVMDLVAVDVHGLVSPDAHDRHGALSQMRWTFVDRGQTRDQPEQTAAAAGSSSA